MMEISAMEVREALREGIARLCDAGVPSYTLAAELLLMHTVGRDRTWIYSHPEVALEPAQASAYFALLARRAAGEPTQYLTGKQEFWSLEFEVNRDVLIPRPETEHVVEVALQRIRVRDRRAEIDTSASTATMRIADIGTGSGCIAVALARELPPAQIFATDISAAALEVARRNAARHGVRDRMHFIRCDLLASFPRPSGLGRNWSGFDAIVSNPPYVARDEAASLAVEVREYEPPGALFGGLAGTEVYARLVEQAAELLRPGGILVLEIGYDSAPRVLPLLSAAAGWTAVTMTNDLAGYPRVIAALRL
jgi:release factor glutamine methyltransferase